MHDWIMTYTGRKFRPLDPDPSQISIVDIAHALSNICRYTGHCKRFYSVASHSLLMAKNAPEYLKLECLLHDASEAYLTDVAKPIKGHFTQMQEAEDRLMQVIFQRFNLQWPMDPRVKMLDHRAYVTEIMHLMSTPGDMLPTWDPDTTEYPEPFPHFLNYFGPEATKYEFLHLYSELTGEEMLS